MTRRPRPCTELGMTVDARALDDTARAETLLRQPGSSTRRVAVSRGADAMLEAIGDTSFRSTTLIQLGETLYAAGRRSTRRSGSRSKARSSARPRTSINYACGRALRARIAADRGDHEAAETLAREALDYALHDRLPRRHGDARTSARATCYARPAAPTRRARSSSRPSRCWERFGWTVERRADAARYW